jgi:hypothetical protein
MTRAQDVFLIVIAAAFLCWGVGQFNRLAAGVLAIVSAAAIVLVALFGNT